MVILLQYRDDLPLPRYARLALGNVTLCQFEI
jgi:hypothetical protein